jgi:Holliday junction resolvase
MGEFNRKFDVEKLKSVGVPEFFTDYLKLWAPAGTQPNLESGRFLRLAVRDGYLNFYYQGQSIGKIEQQASGKLKLSVHEKYLRGTGPSQNYATMATGEDGLNGKNLKDHRYEGDNSIRQWAKASTNHSGPEKRGIDAILSNKANSNIVDLEMGLPAFAFEESGKNSAPRMDIVAIEAGEIRFWEAKTLDDSRLRTKAEMPEVVRQLGTYAAWFRGETEKKAVKNAYFQTAIILKGLWDIAFNSDPSVSELGAEILALAAAKKAPDLETKPSLVCFTGKSNGEPIHTPGNWFHHRNKITSYGDGYVILDHEDGMKQAADNGNTFVDPAKIVLSVR